MRQDKPTAPLSHKHSAHHQLSFPCTRETICPHAPDVAFGNALATTDNKSNDNTVAIPTHYTCRTMGPRVREDDKIRDRKGLIDRSYKEEVGISKDGTGDRTTPLSHKRSAHRHHTTNCHSRAHGKPFIRTRRMPRLETHSPQQNKSNDNTVTIPTYYTRYTMGPRLREDDKIRDRKRLIDQSYKEEVGITKMRQGTSTAPLSHKHSAHRRDGPQLSFPCTRETIYPHARCRVGKYTYRNKQQEQRQYSSNTYPLHSPYHGSPHSRG